MYNLVCMHVLGINIIGNLLEIKLKFHKLTYSEILRIYGVSGPSLLIESMIVKQGTFSCAIICESVGKNLDVL